MADDDVNFSNYESSVTYTTSDGLDKLAEAMIDAYMRRSVPNVVDGSCKEGRFEIITPRVTINHQSDRLYVSYPGGHWTKDGADRRRPRPRLRLLRRRRRLHADQERRGHLPHPDAEQG